MIMGFIDAMRAEGHAVESVCRILREQGCQVAARSYRAWKHPGRVVAARTISDAQVQDLVREIAWIAHPLSRWLSDDPYRALRPGPCECSWQHRRSLHRVHAHRALVPKFAVRWRQTSRTDPA
jgi:hypothetical protein